MKKRRWRTGVAGVTLSSLVLLACDSGEEAVTTTVVVTAPETTVASSSTTSPVETTAVATTLVAATMPMQSTTPSTAPAETTPPTTAEPDLEAAKEAVVAAAVEANDAFRALEQNPLDPVALERWRAAVDGETEQFQLNQIAEMIAAEQSTVPNPTVPAMFAVKLDSVVIDLQSGTASLETCEVNSWVMTQRDSVSGAFVTVDDSVRTVISIGTFTLMGEVWRKTDGSQLSSTEGAVECVG